MDDAAQLLDQAIMGIDHELARHHAGAGTVSSPQQLRAIREELERARQQIAAGNMEPKENRYLSVGRVITDSWPFDNELGSCILAAEQAYLDL